MINNIDFSKLVPTSQMVGESDEETILLNSHLEEAVEYIEFYNWHSGINKSYFGMGVGGIFAVFLFEIIPNRKDIDDCVWVIVGDIPPAYITCEISPNPATALDSYIGAMSEWVEAALSGDSVAELIPVNVPATPEAGESLKTRLNFLDKNVLTRYEDDLKK